MLEILSPHSVSGYTRDVGKSQNLGDGFPYKTFVTKSPIKTRIYIFLYLFATFLAPVHLFGAIIRVKSTEMLKTHF